MMRAIVIALAASAVLAGCSKKEEVEPGTTIVVQPGTPAPAPAPAQPPVVVPAPAPVVVPTPAPAPTSPAPGATDPTDGENPTVTPSP